jgi:hypothetical protein
MRKALAVAAVALAAAFGPGLTAQEFPKPGPQHEKFKQIEGTWEATVHSKEGDSKGVATYKVGVGGLWLLEHFKCDFGGMPFEGRGMTSYDAGKKKYLGVWVDSMSTSPMLTEGNFDAAGKKMTMHGNMAMPDGKSMKLTMVTEHKDADNMVFTLTGAGPDGGAVEMLKISYKRKAKAK